MPVPLELNQFGSGVLAVPPYPAWPLKVSPNGRYLVDQAGRPFRIHGYAHWSGVTVPASLSDINQLITSLKSFRINAVYIDVSEHDSEQASGRTAGNGPQNFNGDFPFTTKIGGGAYAGTGYSGTYDGHGYSSGTTAGTVSADLTTPNSAYFAWLDQVLNAYKNAGIVCMLFPAYTGFGGGDQGWAKDLVDNSGANVTSYAQFLGNRYKNQGNIIWMAYGDVDPSTVTNLVSRLNSLVTGIQGTGDTHLWGGHLPKGNGSPYNDTTIGPLLNLNSVYAYDYASTGNDSHAYTYTLAASQASPATPAFLFDDTGYENDPYDSPVSNTPTNVRKRKWWQLLSSTAGVNFGNEYMSSGGATGSSGTSGTFAAMNGNGTLFSSTTGLPSDGHKHFGALGAIMDTIPWWHLLPANVGAIGTLITAGGGTSGNQDFVTAAASPDGNLMLAYIPPAGAATITIAASAMSVNYTAWWVDPTDATIAPTQIGTFAPGARSFTTPGNNAYGAADWLLKLQG